VFNLLSITACNTRRLVLATIAPMHDSAARLYDAARLLANVEGQSNTARLLNTSPQVLKNWELRGVSLDGAITTEKILGVSPAWLIENFGSMRRPADGITPLRLLAGEERQKWRPLDPPAAPSISDAVDILSSALDHAASSLRDALAANLAGWARSGGADPWRGLVKGLLAGQAATSSPAPRVGNGH